MAVNAWLKLDGIKGESLDSKHKDEIDLLSFSWGMAQPGSFGQGGGGGTSKVDVSDITIMKLHDAASANLFSHCCTGKHIKEGLITVRIGGAQPFEYLKLKFQDLMISSYNTSSSKTDERPAESVSLNFAKVHVEYQEQDAKGKRKGGPALFGWNLKQNKKL